MHEACVRGWKVKWMLGAKRAMWVCNELTSDPPVLLSFLRQLPPICQEQRWLIRGALPRPAPSQNRFSIIHFGPPRSVHLSWLSGLQGDRGELGGYLSPGVKDVRRLTSAVITRSFFCSFVLWGVTKEEMGCVKWSWIHLACRLDAFTNAHCHLQAHRRPPLSLFSPVCVFFCFFLSCLLGYCKHSVALVSFT